MKEKILHREVYVFNKKANGGEQLSLTIDYYDNGDADHRLKIGILNNQELTLQSYCNSASFYLSSDFTPENLRELADVIENGEEIARSKVIKSN